MRVFVPIGCLLLVACATPTVSRQPIDWLDATDRWSLHIVTRDPDGDERVTRIWIAMVDGSAALRTNDTRWWRNLERDPECRIRVDDVDYGVRVVPVESYDEKVRIDEVFLDKYGWMERLMFFGGPGHTHEHYARLR